MGLRPFWGGLPGGGADRHRVEQCLEAGEDADQGEAGGRDVEPAGAVAGEAAPVGQPAEAPLDHPAAGEHDEALGLRVAGNDAMAHPVDVRPLAAALGRERAVVDALAQGGPARLAGVQRLRRVPVLHRGRHDGDREPVPLGVHQRHPLAPDHALGRVVPARAADGDAPHRLGVDDGQRRPRPPPALAPPPARHLAQQGVEQAQLEPAPEPARTPSATAASRPAGRARARPPASARRSRRPRAGPASPARSAAGRPAPATPRSPPPRTPPPAPSGPARAAPGAPRSTSRPPLPSLTIMRPLRRRHGQVGTAGRSALKQAVSAEAGPESVAADIGKRLAALRQARSFVDWQKRPALVRDLDQQRRLILDKVAEKRPDLALELLWRFMALAGPVQERVDDSRGDVGDVFRQACRDLGAVAARASPDPARLADRVLEAVTRNEYGEYDRLVGVVLPALGAAGVARLKERLTAALAARPRARGGYDAAAGALRRALQDVADHEGDVDGFVRHEEGRRSPQRAAPIATRLLAAGRVDEALAALRDGAPAEPSLRDLEEEWTLRLVQVGADAWDRAWVAALLAIGRQEEAQRFRWGRFEARLDAEHLGAYLKALPDFEDVAAERKALGHALAFPHFGMALVFLVDWKALREAARLVLERRGEIDGNQYFVLDPAAKALEGKHPLAAVLLRRAMVEDTLEGAKATRYRHAAWHLLECRGLEAGIGDHGGVEPHEAFVARLRARHGRKDGFWSRVEELAGASGRR